jgi:hypothetical protein
MKKKLILSLSLLSFFLITSCSGPSPFESLSPGLCSDEQRAAVEKHITGQINAMTEKDWPKAYQYAAPSFQSTITLDQFTSIITTGYSMLINNEGFNFTSCKVSEQGVEQEVEVIDNRSEYLFSYRLEVNQSELGVAAAAIIDAAESLNT